MSKLEGETYQAVYERSCLRTLTKLKYENNNGQTVEINETYFEYGGDNNKNGYFLNYDMFVDRNIIATSKLRYEGGKYNKDTCRYDGGKNINDTDIGIIHIVMRGIAKDLREDYLMKQKFAQKKENNEHEQSELAKKRELLKKI